MSGSSDTPNPPVLSKQGEINELLAGRILQLEKRLRQLFWYVIILAWLPVLTAVVVHWWSS